MFWQPGLLKYGIGRAVELDCAVDNEMHLGDRAVPDFVIALYRTHETAANSRLFSSD